MKRINPKTNKPFTRGDIRDEDVRIFKGYLPRLKKDGTFQEEWLLPESFAKIKPRQKILGKKHYQENTDTYIQKATAWNKDNIERKREINAKWRDENRDQHNATNRKWFAANPDKRAALEAKRRSAQLQRTPPWLTAEHLTQIDEFYLAAKMFQMYTGELYHVDHIEPLQGDNVSGLHVPWNLQVIPYKENLQKSNKASF